MSESFAELFEESLKTLNLQAGSIITGVIVEARAQVLMTFLSPALVAATFFISLASVYTPFLIDLLICYFLRRLTINKFDGFFRPRVLTPNACLPHGVFGYFKPIP